MIGCGYIKQDSDKIEILGFNACLDCLYFNSVDKCKEYRSRKKTTRIKIKTPLSMKVRSDMIKPIKEEELLYEDI